MRRIVLSLIVAFLAAIACFVLLSVVGLVLLRILAPGAFADDTLVWISIFAGPAFLAVLASISLVVGLIAFGVARAKLPDWGWQSTQSFAILLTFAATIAAPVAVAWPHFAEPPEVAPQQTGLPTLSLARTLKAPGKWGSPWLLARSADGKRPAADGSPADAPPRA